MFESDFTVDYIRNRKYIKRARVLQESQSFAMCKICVALSKEKENQSESVKIVLLTLITSALDFVRSPLPDTAFRLPLSRCLPH